MLQGIRKKKQNQTTITYKQNQICTQSISACRDKIVLRYIKYTKRKYENEAAVHWMEKTQRSEIIDAITCKIL